VELWISRQCNNWALLNKNTVCFN